MQTDLDQDSCLCLPYALHPSKKNKEERGKGEEEQVGEEDGEEQKEEEKEDKHILFPIIFGIPELKPQVTFVFLRCCWSNGWTESLTQALHTGAAPGTNCRWYPK